MAASNYLENKLVDFLFRGQSFTPPGLESPVGSLYLALYTAAPDDTGGGTEVSGPGYARVAIPCTLAKWAGTQSAGSSTASSGTGGLTSNNDAITFPTPSGSWGTVTHWGLHDTDGSPTGNLWFWGALSTPKAITTDDDVEFVAASLQLTVG